MAPEHSDEVGLIGLDCGIMLHCNDISIPWEVFASAMHELYRLGWGLKLLLAYTFEEFPPPALSTALTILGIRQVWLHGENLTLDTALACCRRKFKAILGQDKVYAVKNIVQHDPVVDQLSPDYSSPTETVYTNSCIAWSGWHFAGAATCRYRMATSSSTAPFLGHRLEFA